MDLTRKKICLCYQSVQSSFYYFDELDSIIDAHTTLPADLRYVITSKIQTIEITLTDQQTQNNCKNGKFVFKNNELKTCKYTDRIFHPEPVIFNEIIAPEPLKYFFTATAKVWELISILNVGPASFLFYCNKLSVLSSVARKEYNPNSIQRE